MVNQIAIVVMACGHPGRMKSQASISLTNVANPDAAASPRQPRTTSPAAIPTPSGRSTLPIDKPPPYDSGWRLPAELWLPGRNYLDPSAKVRDLRPSRSDGMRDFYSVRPRSPPLAPGNAYMNSC